MPGPPLKVESPFLFLLLPMEIQREVFEILLTPVIPPLFNYRHTWYQPPETPKARSARLGDVGSFLATSQHMHDTFGPSFWYRQRLSIGDPVHFANYFLGTATTVALSNLRRLKWHDVISERHWPSSRWPAGSRWTDIDCDPFPVSQRGVLSERVKKLGELICTYNRELRHVESLEVTLALEQGIERRPIQAIYFIKPDMEPGRTLVAEDWADLLNFDHKDCLKTLEERILRKGIRGCQVEKSIRYRLQNEGSAGMHKLVLNFHRDAR